MATSSPPVLGRYFAITEAQPGCFYRNMDPLPEASGIWKGDGNTAPAISKTYSIIRFRNEFVMNNYTTKLQKRRNTMKTSTKDQAEGMFHKVKGKIKEIAGELIDNQQLETEGANEKMAGKVQAKIGQINRGLGK